MVSPTDAAQTHFLLTKMPSAFGQLQGNIPVSDGKGTGEPREKHFGKRPKVMGGERKKRTSPENSQGKTFPLQPLRHIEKKTPNESNENAKQAELR